MSSSLQQKICFDCSTQTDCIEDDFPSQSEYAKPLINKHHNLPQGSKRGSKRVSVFDPSKPLTSIGVSEHKASSSLFSNQPKKLKKVGPFKVVLVGDSAVGKTSFVRSLLDEDFEEEHLPTYGAEVNFYSHKTENEEYEFEIWDISAQDKPLEQRRRFYKNAEYAIVMFDNTSKETFLNSKKWVSEIRQQTSKTIPICVVASKTDVMEGTNVTNDEIQAELLKDGLAFKPISALDNQGLDEPFAELIELKSGQNSQQPSKNEEAKSNDPNQGTAGLFKQKSEQPKSNVDQISTKPLGSLQADNSKRNVVHSPTKKPTAKTAKKEFKLCLVGDGGVGKTCFVKKHLTGEFETKYIATMGVEVQSLMFMTTAGEVTFSIWDTAGQENFGGMRDGYYYGGQCGLIFFDLGSKITLDNVNKWLDELKNSIGNSPICIVGNKKDSANLIDTEAIQKMAEQNGFGYYEISLKDEDVDEMASPFLYLIRKLLGNNEVKFAESEALFL